MKGVAGSRRSVISFRAKFGRVKRSSRESFSVIDDLNILTNEGGINDGKEDLGAVVCRFMDAFD